MNFSIAAGLLGLQETLAPLLGLSPAEGSNALFLRLTALLIGCFGYAYLCIARDPPRYRPYVSLGLIGKLLAVAAVGLSWGLGEVDARLPLLVSLDLLYAILFVDFLRRTSTSAT